jgi:hypothetical protein
MIDKRYMRKKTLNVTNPARLNLANHMWKGFSENSNILGKTSISRRVSLILI